jgi:hypothetical protein
MPSTSEATILSQTSYRSVGRAHADLLEGMQFRAALQMRTPLVALEHDGEIRAVDAELPKYGPTWAGAWIPKPRSELGLAPVDPTARTRCAEIGYVAEDGGAYLPFLKAYRRIVESNESVEKKLQELEVFRRGREHYEFTRGFDGDWPQAVLVSELAHGLPVGNGIAAALFSAGLRDLAQVRTATDEALLAVKGIGPKTLAAIRNAFERAVGALASTASKGPQGLDPSTGLDTST